MVEVFFLGAPLRRHVRILVLGAVVLVQFTQSNGGLTATCAWLYLFARVLYVPAYALGWSPWRSLIFGVGFLATMVMILVALL